MIAKKKKNIAAIQTAMTTNKKLHNFFLKKIAHLKFKGDQFEHIAFCRVFTKKI